MQTVSSKPSLSGDDFELGELLATNKSLAREKRQVHQQKLRQYSEKAVRLRQILKGCTDRSERKCLQSKLHSLQLKHDAEINKLAKIDRIEQEIDEYMQQDTMKSDKSFFVEHGTPAKKLRDLSQKDLGDQLEENLQVAQKQDNLLSSCSKRFYQQSGDKRVLQPLQQNQSKKIHEQNGRKNKIYSQWQGHKTKKIDFDNKSKNKFLQFLHDSNKLNSQIRKINTCKENKITFDDENIKSSEQYLFNRQKQKTQQKLELLISKERLLMERIDSLEQQQQAFSKKLSNLICYIHRSRDIILSSGLVVQQLSDLEIKQKSCHRYSIDSFENSQSPLNVFSELSAFQKILELFLLAAQRKAMLTSGQLQQSNMKIIRIKQEYAMIDAKVKSLEGEIIRLQQTLSSRKKDLRVTQQTINQVKHQFQQLDDITIIKRKLINQLQEKCDKLQTKKKNLAEKLTKIENGVKEAQQEYSNRLLAIKNAGDDLEKCRLSISETQKAFIFNERRLEKVKIDLKNIQSQKDEIQSKKNQTKEALDKLLTQLATAQNILLDVQSRLVLLTSQEAGLQSQKLKIQQQLQQYKTVLDEQHRLITTQNEQINLKSLQIIEAQKKITTISESISALENQNASLKEDVSLHKKDVEQLKSEKEQTKSAKQELEEILRQVILRKEALLEEVELSANELQILLNDLQESQEQLMIITDKHFQLEEDLRKAHGNFNEISNKTTQLQKNIEQLVDEQANILTRVQKLRQAEKKWLLEANSKGIGTLDEEISVRIAEVVADMEGIQKLKNQLRDCKYENRKLRLQNQRFSKLVQLTDDRIKQ